MEVSWYVHLPGVVLEEPAGIAIGPGILKHLTFDEWSQLEIAFTWAERSYEKSRPVFFTGRAEVPEDWSAAIDQVFEWADVLHAAFLLTTIAPILPSPNFSMTYLVKELPESGSKAQAFRRKAGPFEREWIVYGNKISYQFSMSDLMEVQYFYEMLLPLDWQHTFSGLEQGLSTLKLTTRPEFWWDEKGINHINEFIHCMAALENLLLPEQERAPKGLKLTPTFGAHAAVITATNWIETKERVADFSNLYRLRSRLIHGEHGTKDLSPEEQQDLPVGRRLLSFVIKKAIALKLKIGGNQSLSELLAKASQHEQVFKSIFS